MSVITVVKTRTYLVVKPVLKAIFTAMTVGAVMHIVRSVDIRSDSKRSL